MTRFMYSNPFSAIRLWMPRYVLDLYVDLMTYAYYTATGTTRKPALAIKQKEFEEEECHVVENFAKKYTYSMKTTGRKPVPAIKKQEFEEEKCHVVEFTEEYIPAVNNKCYQNISIPITEENETREITYRIFNSYYDIDMIVNELPDDDDFLNICEVTRMDHE